MKSITFNSAQSKIVVTQDDDTEQAYTDAESYLADYPERVGDVAVFDPPEPPSDEQLLAAAKAQRAASVDAIKVTTQAGNEYDGDEVSQGRMARAIIALQATGTPTVKWVLANNVPTDVPVADLVEALALAGGAQAAIWSAPYEA